jgi:hypothetical protein
MDTGGSQIDIICHDYLNNVWYIYFEDKGW